MTKKEYNAIINECRSETCYYCGVKNACNALEKIGIKVGDALTFWNGLSDEKKLRIATLKTNGMGGIING
jgi:hypothetical protein